MNASTFSARGLWFEGPRHAALRDEDVRKPGDNEILVQSIHSLVSAGSEMNLYRGEGNLPTLLLPTAVGSLPFPIKFAYQVVGRVEVAGRSSGYSPGDLVFATHPHQSHFTIQADDDLVFRLPPDVNTLSANFLAMATVGLQTLLEVPIRPGDCVAVSGLGIIGTLLSDLVRRNAGRLVLIDPVAKRREMATWIGADSVVGPEDAAPAIDEMTEGRGVDVFIETSGAPPALQTAILNTGSRGTIAVPAWYGTRPVTLSLSPEFHLKALRIISVWVGNMGGDISARWTGQRRRKTVLEALSRIDPAVLVSHRIKFENAPEAYRILDEHPEEALGVILDYQ